MLPWLRKRSTLRFRSEDFFGIHLYRCVDDKLYLWLLDFFFICFRRMRFPEVLGICPHTNMHKQKLEHRRFGFACFCLLRCAAGQARVVGGEDGEVVGNARASDGGWPRRDGNEDVPGVHQECPQQTRGVLRYAWLYRLDMQAEHPLQSTCVLGRRATVCADGLL